MARMTSLFRSPSLEVKRLAVVIAVSRRLPGKFAAHTGRSAEASPRASGCATSQPSTAPDGLPTSPPHFALVSLPTTGTSPHKPVASSKPS
ncbi:unnamed protein product [Closterium sp. Yama58-4]|nr:unnamed protein product [Closterium sp. Yama58-4]